MTHDLASLLLTETIQYSINVAKKPVYAIFLDAKSAFDRVMKEVLVRNLFLAGTNDHKLLYLDQRLSSRKTYCEFDKTLMGPIHDTRGLEQGGISSSDLYKLYNNEQAQTAQNSGLGVSLDMSFRNIVSCISLADDAVLLANNIIDLQNLLYLTELYCSKYGVELVPDKTRLVAFMKKSDLDASHIQNPLSVRLNNVDIFFSNEAEHLGVLRSSNGNNVNIMNRMSSYKKQLYSLLPAGLAANHRCSPAANLKIEAIYCLPVLLSGLSTLVLNKAELNLIDKLRKNTLARLMKLPPSVPDTAVYFLAGSLPTTAFLHLRQLSLFLMICHLDGNILNKHAKYVLTSCKDASKSWFLRIRDLCVMYNLPHPLQLLEEPPTKEQFRIVSRARVYEYWHTWCCSEVASLSSLIHLRPLCLPLTRPHPLWLTLDGRINSSSLP